MKIDIDNLFERYLAGESLKELGNELGISEKTLGRRIKGAGHQLRTITESRAIFVARHTPDLTPFFERYIAGEGSVKLAREAGVHQSRFIRELDEAGITRRTIGEAVGLRYTQMTKAERQAVTLSANEAKRGRPASQVSFERRARTMEATLQLAGVSDTILAAWLGQRGVINFTLQKAVGRFNLDIAIDEPLIAVEVNGGMHIPKLRALSRSLTTAVERRDYLLNSGWRLIDVMVSGGNKMLRPSCADSVIALIEEARTNEPSWGQYCMIRGDGEFLPTSEAESYYGA
jgi:very-short-patch-repair endonuclease